MINTFFLCRLSLANQSPGGVPPAAWQGPDLKNTQNRIQKRFAASPISIVWEITERMLHYLFRWQIGH